MSYVIRKILFLIFLPINWFDQHKQFLIEKNYNYKSGKTTRCLPGKNSFLVLKFSTLILILYNRGDAEAIERMAYEFCEDIANNGVLYCETRYCPHLLASTGVDGIPHQGNHDGLSPRCVVQCVNKGLERGCEDFGVIVRSILTCMRHRPGIVFLIFCLYIQNVSILNVHLIGY